jgi:plastocyanin
MRLPLVALLAGALVVPAISLAGAPPAKTAATIDVQVDDYFFRPAYARIEPGDSVTWLWRGQDVHNVTSRKGATEAFASDDLLPGAQFSRSFPTPGRYAYHCTLHPEMRGVVQVGPDTIAPELTKAKLKVGKQSVRVSFALDEASKVSLSVASVKKPKKVLRRAGGKKLEDGRRSLSVKRAGLAPGRYRATLTAKDPGANKDTVKITFKLPAPTGG